MQLLLIWLERNSMEISPDLEQAAQDILALNPFACDFTPQLAESLQQLWQDPSIQTAYGHKDETIIPDNVGYFFDKIDDLQDEDYVPSDDDVLRVRVRSIGIDSITFDLDGAIIRIYDVGGQKNERSKWEKIMSEVGGCIYFVSLAEFDKPMFEDIQMVRINDSLEVFSQVVKKEEFREAPIFLICNKFDEFTEKIRETDCFTKVFPEYIGDPHDPDKCAQYIVDKFLERG
ncbi:G-protein alpha subunit [Histomonas meleagridis]|uniref:G-protein alpha subunit n=1 Tax=Histomonas meleagridis TaxID=135588 RepID=UPI00355AA37B|nr:G-protein alpha subunit [Histomonas meleagridis]